ncbi:MAG: hypothetical protein V1905_02785 [bacterium]
MKTNLKIAVSGAAVMGHCSPGTIEKAREVGREIARLKCVTITGATTGVPYYSALGAKELKGYSVGFSPATSEKSHLKSYRLPVDAFDVIIYTGADYVGRNVIMTKSADGVIIICGRMGTLHEFATAFEIEKPIAVLEGTGGTADRIRYIMDGPSRGLKREVIFDTDPKRLVDRLVKIISKTKQDNDKIDKRSMSE